MKTFFLCSIGPVQDFIATARKSRDLWYGSRLLSELAKTAAKCVVDSGGKLIFPSPDDQKHLDPNETYNVPNKIMAAFEKFEPGIAENVRRVMQDRVLALWENALRKVKGPLDTPEFARNQILDLLEYYWVAVPFETDDQYKQARESAEAYLAARKNTRDFKQHIGKEKPKSSLDGFRESVIPWQAYPTNRDPEETRNRKIRALYRNYHAGEAEQLSGVDLLKRLGTFEGAPEFPSTSDFAASPFFQRINAGDPLHQKEKEKEMLGKIREQILLPKGWTEEDIQEGRALVFESRLSEYFSTQTDREEAREKLAAILDSYAGKKRPNPYYALLIADGDNMGMLIDTKEKADEHRDLSKLISRFALDVPEIIKQYGGACIYAGGEDILAYLPLQNALVCASDLDQAFKDLMSGDEYKFKNKEGKEMRPTLSGGIIIAHHLTPLSDVLGLARQAEREAKFVKNKNALAIVLNKRSGSERLIKANWPELIKRLEIMVELVRKKWISNGTAYELQRLHSELSGVGIVDEDRALAAEAVRIVKRKRQSKSDEKLSSDVIKQFDTWITQEDLSLQELALEMIISNEFAGAEDMANKPIKEVLT